MGGAALASMATKGGERMEEKRLYTVVQMDFASFDKKLRRVVELRNELTKALSELNEVDSEPYLVLKEENPAPKE